MTTISSKEFASNPDKYFDLAENEEVYIQDGEHTFVLTRTIDDFEDDDDYIE